MARLSSEKLAARCSPLATSARQERTALQRPVEGPGQGDGVAGRDEEGVLVRSGHIPVSDEVAGHDRSAGRHALQEDHPEALSVQGGGAQDVSAPDPPDLLPFADDAEPLDPVVVAGRLAQAGGVGPFGGDPEAGVEGRGG